MKSSAVPFLAMIRRANRNAIAAGQRAEAAARRQRRAPILPIGTVVEEAQAAPMLIYVIAAALRHRARRPALRLAGRSFAPSAMRRKPP